MASLFTIAEQFRALERLADDDVPPEVIADTLEGLEGELEVKAVNIIKFAMNLEHDAAGAEMLAEAYKERAKRINKKATGLRDYLKSVMEVLGRHKIETPEVTLAVRKNPAAVVIDDATIVPRSFKSTPPSFADVIFAPPPDTSPDKKAIVDALKAYAALVEKIPAGEAIPATPVPGARLTVATRLEVKI